MRETAMVQNNYPIITSILPSDKRFASFCRFRRQPLLFFRLEVITAVSWKPHTTSSSTHRYSLTNHVDNTVHQISVENPTDTHVQNQINTGGGHYQSYYYY